MHKCKECYFYNVTCGLMVEDCDEYLNFEVGYKIYNKGFVDGFKQAQGILDSYANTTAKQLEVENE